MKQQSLEIIDWLWMNEPNCKLNETRYYHLLQICPYTIME